MAMVLGPENHLCLLKYHDLGAAEPKGRELRSWTLVNARLARPGGSN